MDFKIEKNDIRKNKWKTFVYNHKQSNIFQTPEMYEVYQNTKNCEPVFLSIINKNDEISGALLAVIQKEIYGGLGKFTARSIIHGGPLIKNNDPDTLDLILKKYYRIIKNKAIYTQIRNFNNVRGSIDIFIKNGFEYKEHLNLLVDLTKPEEQLWKELHSKRRNEIRKAKKEGVRFAVEHTEDAIKKCYVILQEVYKRAKLPIPYYNFLLNLYNMNSCSELKTFCAYYDNDIIGCMLALCYKDTIYDLYAGSMMKFYNKHPNDMIPWEVFKWGKENNYKCFNFGGAGKPDVPYGVRDYKLKFGGELVNYGRFEIVHQPMMYKIAKAGFILWQNIKK